MSGPHTPIDPTFPPFDPIAWQAELDDAWDAGFAAAETNRRGRVVALILAALSGAVIAGAITAAIVHAAPRSAAQPVIPVATIQGGTSGNLAAQPSGAPTDLSPVVPPSGGRRFPAGAPLPPPSPAITEPPAIEAGLASYCAPTPTRCQSWGGDAHLAAVPSFRYGDRPYRVTVCRQDDLSRCTTVRVVSFCGCGNKIIDLSPAAFRELAPLSRGIVPVTVQDAAGPGITAPPTDTEP